MPRACWSVAAQIGERLARSGAMGTRLLCLCLAAALLAYSAYTPMPPDFDQPWRVMLLSAASRAGLRVVSGAAGAAERGRRHTYLLYVWGDRLRKSQHLKRSIKLVTT